MRKTKSKTLSLPRRTTSLILALLLLLSAASVGFATLASAITVDDDSGGLADTGAVDEMLAPTSNYTDEITDYTAKVETNPSSLHDTKSATWVDATYYDYLSDKELSDGWLNPIQAGTGFNNSLNDWFEFKSFNTDVSNKLGAGTTFPLYFGNMCSNRSSLEGNNAAHDDYRMGDGFFGNYISGLNNFDYAVNDSNGLFVDANAQQEENPDYNCSVAGLANNSLDENGNILFPDGQKMPYFDANWLSSTKHNGKSIGTSIKSSFPFRSYDDNGLITYEFDSQDGKDNVFFNWNRSGNGTPTSVGYVNGNTQEKLNKYAIDDGLKYFMSDTQSGKGIFPYNRGGDGYNGGNNKLDYGFGIKINMNFRVPESGKINGKDIKFEYSGDDDLWVYLSEYDDDGELCNSQLVLDLGGNHKKAQGVINFATMQSYTTTRSMTPTVNSGVRRDRIYIQDSYGWNDIWVYAWNKGSDAKWYHAQYDSSAGLWYVGANWGPDGDMNGDRLDSKSMFKVTGAKYTSGSWDKETDKQDDLAVHWGKKTYTDNLHYCKDYAVNYSYTSSGTNLQRNFGYESNGNGTFKTLDPDKTYHLTVFYMERGMLESNCKIKFTMIPVKNDLYVRKTVNTEEVNSGLVSDVNSLPFSFTTQEELEDQPGVYETRKDTRYIHNDLWKNVNSSTGVYQLKHEEYAYFTNQHRTGAGANVKELDPNGGVLQYSTTWEVIDRKTGDRLQLRGETSDNTKEAVGTGLVTDNFPLLNPNKPYALASLEAHFINTPKVAPLSFTKTVVDKNDQEFDPSDDPEFQFLVKLDIGLGMKTYDLAYSIDETNYTATRGVIKLKANQTAVIEGIPAGATYTIEEIPTDGYYEVAYTVNGDTTEVGGSVSGIVSGAIHDPDSDETDIVEMVNKPFEGAFAVGATKLIRSAGETGPYSSGSLFSFKLSGLKDVNYEQGKTSADASDISKTVGAVTNGNIEFDNENDDLTFYAAGVYIFKLQELPGVTIPSGGSGISYDEDVRESEFAANTQTFLVKINVHAGEGGLVADEPVYYAYSGSGALTPSDFTNPLNGKPEFVNRVTKTGKITVNKKDGGSSSLGGVQFSVYRKDGNTETLVDTKTTGSDGKVEFSNLNIYEVTNGAYSGVIPYQTYVLKETKTKDGYMMEDTVYEFSFPMYDIEEEEYKYEFTFDYANAALKHPEAGISDFFNRMPLGVALVFLSFVAIGAYIATLRKKQLASKHTPRFYQ